MYKNTQGRIILKMSSTVLYRLNYKRSSVFEIDTANSAHYELQDSNFHQKVGGDYKIPKGKNKQSTRQTPL
jgi:hypothetical protein